MNFTAFQKAGIRTADQFTECRPLEVSCEVDVDMELITKLSQACNSLLNKTLSCISNSADEAAKTDLSHTHIRSGCLNGLFGGLGAGKTHHAYDYPCSHIF